MNPLLMAIASACGFVARGFAGDPVHLSRLFQEGIRFKGFAFIDILQPCLSFNRINTFQWYASRVYKINEEPGYDPENRMMAFKGAQEWGERSRWYTFHSHFWYIIAFPLTDTYECPVIAFQQTLSTALLVSFCDTLGSKRHEIGDDMIHGH